MRDPACVGGRQARRDLQRVVDGLARRHGPVAQLLAEGLALEQFHHRVGVPRSTPKS